MIVFVSFSLENLGHRNKLPTRPLPRVKTRYDIWTRTVVKRRETWIRIYRSA